MPTLICFDLPLPIYIYMFVCFFDFASSEPDVYLISQADFRWLEKEKKVEIMITYIDFKVQRRQPQNWPAVHMMCECILLVNMHFTSLQIYP